MVLLTDLLIALRGARYGGGSDDGSAELSLRNLQLMLQLTMGRRTKSPTYGHDAGILSVDTI